MAYLRRGWTGVELRRRYEHDMHLLNNDQLERRYGRPPYWFLEENAGGNPAPTYNQFVGLLVDRQQREYTPVGEDEPNAAFVRLPRGVTARQNTVMGVLTTPPEQRMDYPQPGDRLVMRSRGTSEDDSSAPTWTLSVYSVDLTNTVGGTGRRVATGRVHFHERVPQRAQIETDAQARRRDEQMERALDPSSSSSSSAYSSSSSSSPFAAHRKRSAPSGPPPPKRTPAAAAAATHF